MSAIEETIQKWHLQVKGQYAPGLDDLLHDDVEFYSPVVFTPQKGKEVTKLYLGAAGATLGEGKDLTAQSEEKKGDDIPFRYIKEVMSGNTAVLEFERTIDGKYMNGIDIITVDDDGKIVEFKVMVRPLQAINALHKMMAAMLDKMKSA